MIFTVGPLVCKNAWWQVGGL